MWWNLLLLIITSVISAALAPRPKPPQPASMDDAQVPTAEDGREIPVVFGTCWISGPNVLWYGDMGTEAIRTCSGKK